MPRQFWPIWALMAFVGLAAQWVAIRYYRDDSRTGGLAFMALGWTCLYAFAVAAAAFAGERETRTLHLLDALPVERWRLWTAKVSFALGVNTRPGSRSVCGRGDRDGLMADREALGGLLRRAGHTARRPGMRAVLVGGLEQRASGRGAGCFLGLSGGSNP